MRRALLVPVLAGRTASVPPPSLSYDFTAQTLNPVTGSKALTFTRASTGWRFNSSRLLEAISTNNPRYDYDPISGEYLGLLIELSAVNICWRNRDFTNAVWVKTNVSAALTQTGIDGTANSASAITASAGNGTVLQSRTAASGTRSVSCYVKRLAGTGTLEMTMDNGSTWVNVTSQILGTGPSGFSRVSIPIQTVTNPVMGFRIGTSGDSFAVDCFQCEAGRLSSPIPNAGSANVTRSAETVVADASGIYLASGVSLLLSYRQNDPVIAGSNVKLLTFQDNLASGTVYAGLTRRNSATTVTADVSAANDAAVIDLSATVDLSTFVFQTVAGRLRANDAAIHASNGASATDTSGDMPSAASIVYLTIGANLGGTAGIAGHVRKAQVWSTRLSRNQLRALVS